ncbi:Os1348 family NHLP clan protein [Dactylosporangium sp. CA-233914]|uniref:Os1348 family NHLP clan protein n=1 Tax=Dactylosporangium sp. CA-233914 TaxID=3239934 RepID=UPI003D922651
MTTAEIPSAAEAGEPAAADPAAAAQSQVKEVLERAVADPGFARQLLDDPDTALEGYDLTEVQLLLLRSLDEEDLAKLTPENLEEFFAVDSAVYTPEDAAMVQQGYEIYDEEDLDD